LCAARLEYPINGKGRGDAFELVGAEIVAHEVALDNMIHYSTDDDCIRCGKTFKPRRNIGGFAEREVFMPTSPAYLPDDNGSGMDANADSKLNCLFSFQTHIQLFYCHDNVETGPHCTLNIVLMCLWVAKIDE
jgi:hypothetical protein